MGRSHGLAGLLECVRTKTIVEDRFAAWAQPWWFGGHAGERAAAIDAFAQLAHGRGLGARLRGLPATARLVLRRPTGGRAAP